MARRMSSGTCRAPGQLRAALVGRLKLEAWHKEQGGGFNALDMDVAMNRGARRNSAGEDGGGEQGMGRGRSVTWTDVARDGLHAK